MPPGGILVCPIVDLRQNRKEAPFWFLGKHRNLGNLAKCRISPSETGYLSNKCHSYAVRIIYSNPKGIEQAKEYGIQ